MVRVKMRSEESVDDVLCIPATMLCHVQGMFALLVVVQ